MKIDVAVLRGGGGQEEWKVFVDGQVTTPSFNSKGSAQAYGDLIESGNRQPEFGSRPVHPAFLRAAALDEPLRSHFPKNVPEAENWEPIVRVRALSTRVLAVARTRVECSWAAYIDAVPGQRHSEEFDNVLDHGSKLDEKFARVLFPEFKEVPYAW